VSTASTGFTSQDYDRQPSMNHTGCLLAKVALQTACRNLGQNKPGCKLLQHKTNAPVPTSQVGHHHHHHPTAPQTFVQTVSTAPFTTARGSGAEADLAGLNCSQSICCQSNCCQNALLSACGPSSPRKVLRCGLAAPCCPQCPCRPPPPPGGWQWCLQNITQITAV
jgi:hypothetical protein